MMSVSISYFALALALAATGHFVSGEDDTDILVGEPLNLTAVEMSNLPANCEEAYNPARGDGVYLINCPDSGLEPFRVYCSKDPNEVVPWTTMQRRVDATNFYRPWDAYKFGFGNMRLSFHLGMEATHCLTKLICQELRIRLRCGNGRTMEAKYNCFRIGDEYQRYELQSLGNYTGNAGDSLTAYHLHMPMSTLDAKNDQRAFGNSAEINRGAWWYGPTESDSNLNGVYPSGRSRGTIYWTTLGNLPITYVQMDIRPARY